MDLSLGTSGYYYKDWVGPFYPEGTKRPQMLGLYAREFRALEINFTYYGLPRAGPMEKMSRETPEGFEFIVKLHKTFTHENSLKDKDEFTKGLSPLRESGKLRGLLAQFPYSFKNTAGSRAHLAQLGEAFEEDALFVEFRHGGWIEEPVFSFLSDIGACYVSVDEPRIRGLVPPVARVTGDAGYVRFHSRAGQKWYAKAGGRYDYDYSEEELREWLPNIRSMSEASKVFVFFNNCHGAQAALNARSMRKILEQEGLL